MARKTGTIEDTLKACINMWEVFGDDATLINSTPRDYFKSHKAMYPKELSEQLVKDGVIAYDKTRSTSKNKFIFWNVKAKPNMKWLESVIEIIREKKAETARKAESKVNTEDDAPQKYQPTLKSQNTMAATLIDRLNTDLYLHEEELKKLEVLYEATKKEVGDLRTTVKTLERYE